MSHSAFGLDTSPYQSYAYSYPHKMAYRPLRPAVPLAEAWAGESRDSRFLYLHVPFCEMRCGFCNLFTTANPEGALEAAYLHALRREAEAVSTAAGPARITRMAIGGGTPTYLAPEPLSRLFDLARDRFGVDPRQVPTSVETSPRTADPDRLAVLAERGVRRISIGIQSFVEAECAAAGRAQRVADVEAALDRIRARSFPCLNLDLIYGLPGQTVESWLHSVQQALRWCPEELYLYPLYVRPFTGLDGRATAEDAFRLRCYREARALLLDRGYAQVSMRMFRLAAAEGVSDSPDYCCQDDGMLGLGCGARSYTRSLHYSTEYAVGRPGVRAILESYRERATESFRAAQYGFRLDAEEQRRRYLIKSLLRTEGLNLPAYRRRFGTEVRDDFPELQVLTDAGLILPGARSLVPTPRGLELSDAVGPWLYSPRVRAAITEFVLR